MFKPIPTVNPLPVQNKSCPCILEKCGCTENSHCTNANAVCAPGVAKNWDSSLPASAGCCVWGKLMLYSGLVEK